MWITLGNSVTYTQVWNTYLIIYIVEKVLSYMHVLEADQGMEIWVKHLPFLSILIMLTETYLISYLIIASFIILYAIK